MNMIEKNRTTILWTALFWGSVWGAIEATLGFVLHLLPLPGLAGAMMFPVGLVCLQAARERGGLAAMAAVPVIAAALKLLDLLVPGHNPVSVIHPALSILLQGAVLAAGYGFVRRSALHLGMASLAWKGLFFAVLLSGLTGRPGITAAPAGTIALFFGAFTVLEVVLARFALHLEGRERGYLMRPLAALGSLCVAGALQLVMTGLA